MNGIRVLSPAAAAAPDRSARLIDRLGELRDEMLDRMRRRGEPEPGHLQLLAGVSAALAMLEGPPAAARMGARAVVSDDGRQIRLTLYGEAGAIGSVVLDGWRAVRLAGRLLHGAGTRLGR
jgi:hypothetical protein